jgi:hypothetical protein
MRFLSYENRAHHGTFVRVALLAVVLLTIMLCEQAYNESLEMQRAYVHWRNVR